MYVMSYVYATFVQMVVVVFRDFVSSKFVLIQL